METVTPIHTEYSEPVGALIDQHHKSGVGPHECARCAASCCSHGGFAILENVQLIYERYRQGNLVRADYQFVGGLSFREFVNHYFDVQTWSPEDTANDGQHLMLFYMKSLGPGGNPIAVPAEPDTYRETRQELFAGNPWLNKGCVFLSEATPEFPANDYRSERSCILHDDLSVINLTAKPVDCVLFTCTAPLKQKPLGGEEAGRWLAALAESYPNSAGRFERLMQEKI